MIFFDGTYRLNRRKAREHNAREGSGGAWHVRIIDFSLARPEVAFLRPHAVVVVPEGAGPHETTCAESLGLKICRDFGLNIRETLWVEARDNGDGTLQPAVCTRLGRRGVTSSAATIWRLAHTNELAAIRIFLPQSDRLNGLYISAAALLNSPLNPTPIDP